MDRRRLLFTIALGGLDADEGHGFRKKQNVDAQREAETMFLSKVFGL